MSCLCTCLNSSFHSSLLYSLLCTIHFWTSICVSLLTFLFLLLLTNLTSLYKGTPVWGMFTIRCNWCDWALYQVMAPGWIKGLRHWYAWLVCFYSPSEPPMWPDPPIDLIRSSSRQIFMNIPRANESNPDRPFQEIFLALRFAITDVTWSSLIPWPPSIAPGTVYVFPSRENVRYEFSMRGRLPNGELTSYSSPILFTAPSPGESIIINIKFFW